MSTAPNGARRLVSQWRPSTSDQSICKSCLATLHRRRHASAAAAATRVEEPAAPVHYTPPVIASSSPRPSYQINAGVVLSRPPVITRDLTPFEKAYFFYQRRLNERLALPFGRYFYYEKGAPGDLEWKRKIKERQTPARDIGVYNAYSKEGWNDELLLGAKESEPENQVEALLRDAEDTGKEDEDAGDAKKEAVEKPMPRVTEADKMGDVKSLNRLLQRTLYLLVKGAKGGWTFPTAGLAAKEDLHKAAERIIVQAGGFNINTWVVGNLPVGHQSIDFPKTTVDQEKKIEQLGEKTFFMKARIMAGQANLEGNKLGLEDFKWLAKEEIQKEVHPRYWSDVRNMLVER